MTVSELIIALRKFPRDMLVVTYDATDNPCPVEPDADSVVLRDGVPIIFVRADDLRAVPVVRL